MLSRQNTCAVLNEGRRASFISEILKKISEMILNLNGAKHRGNLEKIYEMILNVLIKGGTYNDK